MAETAGGEGTTEVRTAARNVDVRGRPAKGPWRWKVSPDRGSWPSSWRVDGSGLGLDRIGRLLGAGRGGRGDRSTRGWSSVVEQGGKCLARGADGGRSGPAHREMRLAPRSGSTRAGTVDVWVPVIVNVELAEVGRTHLDRGPWWVARHAMTTRGLARRTKRVGWRPRAEKIERTGARSRTRMARNTAFASGSVTGGNTRIHGTTEGALDRVRVNL